MLLPWCVLFWLWSDHFSSLAHDFEYRENQHLSCCCCCCHLFLSTLLLAKTVRNLCIVFSIITNCECRWTDFFSSCSSLRSANNIRIEKESETRRDTRCVRYQFELIQVLCKLVYNARDQQQLSFKLQLHVSIFIFCFPLVYFFLHKITVSVLSRAACIHQVYGAWLLYKCVFFFPSLNWNSISHFHLFNHVFFLHHFIYPLVATHMENQRNYWNTNHTDTRVLIEYGGFLTLVFYRHLKLFN